MLPEDAPTLYFPALVMKLADGSYIVRPGKPVTRASATKTSKWCGISTANLRRLADAGYIRRGWSGPGVSYYYPAEVESFLLKTEAEADFWTEVRRNVYITSAYARDIRNKKR